eukprot:scpid105277/ scgid33787/ 
MENAHHHHHLRIHGRRKRSRQICKCTGCTSTDFLRIPSNESVEDPKEPNPHTWQSHVNENSIRRGATQHRVNRDLTAKRCIEAQSSLCWCNLHTVLSPL